jgi:hypothetical protein
MNASTTTTCTTCSSRGGRGVSAVILLFLLQVFVVQAAAAAAATSGTGDDASDDSRSSIRRLNHHPTMKPQDQPQESHDSFPSVYAAIVTVTPKKMITMIVVAFKPCCIRPTNLTISTRIVVLAKKETGVSASLFV